jgi:hypothetical protein
MTGQWRLRPLGTWTGPVTAGRKSSGVFRARWRDTTDLLAEEAGLLCARFPLVIQADVQESDLRLDGTLKARSQVGPFPGVAVSFESRHGPLRYASDAYERSWSGSMPGWQANVRAVALALAALRAVDRYGVSRRGEQYTGWLALPASTSSLFGSAAEAETWIRGMADEHGQAGDLATVCRALARRAHPDAGGDRGTWDRVAAARGMLIAGRLL